MKELHPGSQTHPQVYLFSVWQKEEECVRSQTAPYVTSLGAVFWIFRDGLEGGGTRKCVCECES